MDDTRLGPAGRLGRFFINSKLTPLVVLASLALGAVAIWMTPREEEPQIIVPMVDLFVGLPGASPEEVESRVTIPLEKRMWEVPGVEYVYSMSASGLSMITVRFKVGADEQDSLVKVYEKISSGLDRMEEGFTLPLARLRSIDQVPVLALTLWSRTSDRLTLRRLAAQLERDLTRLEDVSQSIILGGSRRQVSVSLSPEGMAARGLDPAAVSRALAMQNISLPAGELDSPGGRVQVETGGFLRDVQDLRALVVGIHDGRPVSLQEVAQIQDGPAEISDYVFFVPGVHAAGQVEHGDLAVPAVTLALAKRQGADASRVVDAIMARVKDLRGSLIPADVQVTVTRDYGATASEKAGELLTHLMGAILAVTLVVAFFLGWRGGIVVFVSVPVTFALTLFVYYLFGYTLNRVTLFALIFVTGIVVDDSIIVVENIVRHFAMKKQGHLQAAIAAVEEVGNPTILATLTVIAAVLPMAFVRGLMGPYMRPMPVGAAVAMIFSLVIALMAAPWFSYRLVRDSAGGEHGDDYDVTQTRTYRIYRWIMLPFLTRPRRAWWLLGVVGILLLGSMALVPLKAVTVKMLPFDNKSEMQILVDMPEGTPLERTLAVTRELASSLSLTAEVTHMQMYVGTSAPVNFNGLVRHYDLRRGSHQADIQVNFLPKGERRAQSHELARRLRPALQEVATRHGAALKVVEIPPGPPVLATLVAEVYHRDGEKREQLAGRIRDLFTGTEGVVDVDWTVAARQAKQVLEVDREKAALHGVPVAELARALHLAVSGETAGWLQDAREAESVPIVLRLPLSRRSDLDDLLGLKVAGLGGAMVPVSELVRPVATVTPPPLFRKNLRPVIYVTGDVAGRQESPVYAILNMAASVPDLGEQGGSRPVQYYRSVPASDEGPVVKWDGEWHISYEVFRDLGLAFGLVLVLIYVLIVGWFSSFKVPAVMMIAIPLALVGVLPAHAAFGIFFTATSMIGFIALAGIIVRNSVLLIDFINLSQATGKDLLHAVLEAGAVRFRPILLTAGTVVVGAVVILFDPIFQGLAVSLMAGAIASTVLTLVVVPLVHFMSQGGK
jgi:multidrug efflux pump subunit AcrB